MVRYLLLLSVFLLIPKYAAPHSGGLNKKGCHNNTKTGDYHCHRSSGIRQMPTKKTERYYNALLAQKLGGRTEISYSYNYRKKETSHIVVDVETQNHVIEGGFDKRSSLDSVQQAVFASSLSGKKPAVAIYDTDGKWGKYEYRIWKTSKALGIKFIWMRDNRIVELK